MSNVGRNLGIGLVLAVCAAGGAWYVYSHYYHNPKAAGEGNAKGSANHGQGNQQAAVQVVAVAVQERNVQVYLDGLGTVQAYNTVTVRPQIDGQISRIAFTEGQEVQKGDLLAELDPRTYQAQLDEALARKKQDEAKKIQDQAKVVQDQAKENQDQAKKKVDQAAINVAEAKKTQDNVNLANTRVNYKRYSESYISAGAVTEQQVADQKALVAQLEATVQGDDAAIQATQVAIVGDDAAIQADKAGTAADQAAIQADDAAIQADEATIKYAQTFLSYTKINSPISGRTGVRQVDAGNIVHVGDAAGIVVVTQLKPISVTFTLPQQDFPRINARMAVAKLPVLAVEADRVTEIERGELELIDNQIDQVTGTIHLKATFQNKKGRLWPGGFVNVRLLLETHEDAPVVDAPAVQQGPENTYVYVVKPDGTVEPRNVEVALIQDGRAMIASGVKAGETVVLTGHDRLKAGMHVTATIRKDKDTNKKAGGESKVSSPDGEPPASRKKDAHKREPKDIQAALKRDDPRTDARDAAVESGQ